MLKSTTSIDTLFVGCSGIEAVFVIATIDILPYFKHLHKLYIIQNGLHFNEKSEDPSFTNNCHVMHHKMGLSV